MDLEVIGKHALMFDDDALAEFVNSDAALVDWNSLSIDRYDVRHLLSGPLPLRSSRRQQLDPEESSLHSELDHERYLDLSPLDDVPDSIEGGGGEEATGYHTVALSYSNSADSDHRKCSDAESAFCPPFSVPSNIPLPPTEKIHQIIARTATFVSIHGGQSEIVLRVKQGNNPTFGFLLPDNVLHHYFRYLVDHQELLKTGVDENATGREEARAECMAEQNGGSLSLLGSMYGSVDDEDDPSSSDPLLSNLESSNSGNLLVSGKSDPKNQKSFSRFSGAYMKESSHVKTNSAKNSSKSSTFESKKHHGVPILSSSSEKPLVTSSGEGIVLEPSSEMKTVVDKIVEFILRNGREFEPVLVQQDTKHGRFPFLIKSNPYYPYYLKILREAQESRSGKKIAEKDRSSERDASRRKTHDERLSEADARHDHRRKDKLRLTISESKKESEKEPPKVSVDTAAAAAILQAATKGIKTPNLNFLTHRSLNGSSSSDCGASGKMVDVNVAREDDSSEAKEQKLKAERLKRAKLFAAMIKNGAAPLRDDASGSLVMSVVNKADDSRSKRSYRSRRVDDEDDEEEASGEERKRKHSRTKKRSHRHKAKHSPKDDVGCSDDGDDDGHHERGRKHSRSRKRHRNREDFEEDERRHSDRKHSYRHSDSEEEDRKREHRGERSYSRRQHGGPLPEDGRRSEGENDHKSEVEVKISDDLRTKIRAMLMSTL